MAFISTIREKLERVLIPKKTTKKKNNTIQEVKRKSSKTIVRATKRDR